MKTTPKQREQWRELIKSQPLNALSIPLSRCLDDIDDLEQALEDERYNAIEQWEKNGND